MIIDSILKHCRDVRLQILEGFLMVRMGFTFMKVLKLFYNSNSSYLSVHMQHDLFYCSIYVARLFNVLLVEKLKYILHIEKLIY